jgi:hypothetical protein
MKNNLAIFEKYYENIVELFFYWVYNTGTKRGKGNRHG